MRKKRIVGIYLAAGKSIRMGENKLNLPFRKKRLGNHALLTAINSTIDHVFVITREKGFPSWIDPCLYSGTNKDRWTAVTCPDASSGQAFSIKCGVEEAIRYGAEAVVIILADQPLLRSYMINNLTGLYRQNREIEYIASSFKGRLQPPILFSNSFFSVLQQLEGNKGARSVLQKSTAFGRTITYTDGKGFYDIDTKEDYKWIKNQMEC